eukprot:1086540-Rhodomonas_salina.1
MPGNDIASTLRTVVQHTYRKVIETTSVLNAEPVGEKSSSCAQEGCHISSFDFPLYVMNLPQRHDRKQHTERMLLQLSFSNVVFPNVTLSQDLNLSKALEEGLISETFSANLEQQFGERGARSYAANTLDQIQTIRSGETQLFAYAIVLCARLTIACYVPKRSRQGMNTSGSLRMT